MTMGTFSAFTRFKFGALIFTALTFTAAGAQAGFEWVPPAPETQAPAPAPKAAPAPTMRTMHMQPETTLQTQRDNMLMPVETEELLLPPLPDSEPEMVPFSAKHEPTLETPDRASPPMMAPVIMPNDAPSSARKTVSGSTMLNIKSFPAQTQTAAPTPVKNNDVIVNGFGSNMPLALALQQIAPPGYAFSFGENVNPGTKVSWTGGKGWMDVMHDMLTPLGLKTKVRGSAIFVHHEQHSQATPDMQSFMPQAPAASASAMTEAKSAETSTEPLSLRRQNIKDPGQQALQQPVKTLGVLEKTASTSTTVNDPNVPKTIKIWEAHKGDSMKNVLTSWSREGAFDLQWNAAHDYMLQADILVAGQFDNALESLMRSGVNTENSPQVRFVKNRDGHANTLIIESNS